MNSEGFESLRSQNRIYVKNPNNLSKKETSENKKKKRFVDIDIHSSSISQEFNNNTNELKKDNSKNMKKRNSNTNPMFQNVRSKIKDAKNEKKKSKRR